MVLRYIVVGGSMTKHVEQRHHALIINDILQKDVKKIRKRNYHCKQVPCYNLMCLITKILTWDVRGLKVDNF